MFNKINLSYSYSLAIFKLIKDYKLEFDNLISIFNLLNLVVNDYSLIKYYKFNKKNFIESILHIINMYIIDNYIINKIVSVIFEDDMFFFIKYIFLFLENMYEKDNNILKIYIYSSNKISDKNLNIIKKNFSEKYIKFKVIFILKINKKLIAGFKVLVNDLVYDFSLLNKIKKINFIF